MLHKTTVHADLLMQNYIKYLISHEVKCLLLKLMWKAVDIGVVIQVAATS